jgi:hypothetical protein
MRIRGGHAVSLYVQSYNDAEFQQQTDLPLVFLRVVVRNIARSWQSPAFHRGGFHSVAIHNVLSDIQAKFHSVGAFFSLSIRVQ